MRSEKVYYARPLQRLTSRAELMAGRQPTFARKKIGPAPTSSVSVFKSRRLRRKCACGGTLGPTGECEECHNKRLNSFHSRSARSAPDAAPPAVYEALRSPGQPLDANTRAFSEARFGHDFGQVRVHTDSRAAKSARTVNALAYTVGNDVFFGANQYAPHSREGQRLLTHELTHTVQQDAKAPSAVEPLAGTSPEDVGERQARDATDAVARGNTVSVISQSGRQLARQDDDENGGTPDAGPSDAGPTDASLPGGVTTPPDAESAAPSSPTQQQPDGGLTTGEEVLIGVLIGAAVVGGIALILLSGGTTAPAVIVGLEAAGDLAVGTELAAGTTVVGEAVAGEAAATATATEAAATMSSAATVTAEDAIGSGLVNAGGRLASVLQAIQAQFAAIAPTNAMATLSVVQTAVRSLGLDIGVAAMNADGSIALTNVGGVITTILTNGAIIITNAAGQVVLRLP